MILGEQFQRFEKLILILGEILQKKYVKEETGIKFAQFLKKAASDANLSAGLQQIIENKLSQESKERILQALNYSF